MQDVVITSFLTLSLVLIPLAVRAHPARQLEQAVIQYRRNFDHGYRPFADDSVPNPKTQKTLSVLRHCNLKFVQYLRANRSRIRLTPPDQPFRISVLIVIANLYKVSEKDQTVTLTAFIELSWKDRRLADIGGDGCKNVTRVLPDLSSLFFPVFTIENSAERVLYNEAWEKFPVAVYRGGVVVWIISLRLILNCNMNMKTFPYDSQNCFILLRSPHYYVSDLQYYVHNKTNALLLLNENVNHPLWKLEYQMPKMTSSNISGIEFWFRLDRKPSFYIWTLIMPTMLVSIATVLPFLLPSSADEKMQTCLSGILAYFLLLMTMTDVTPQTSEDIPVLTLFYVIIIGIGMLGAAVCALIVRLNQFERRTQRKNLKRTIIIRKPRKRKLNQNHNGYFDFKTATRHDINCATWKKLISSKFLNDCFLMGYTAILLGSYIWLFAYMHFLRAELDAANMASFNYSKVKTFH